MSNYIRHIFLLVMCLLLVCCARYEPDERLTEIAGYIDTRPKDAISALDSISPSQLSEADRHYYDLLTIKANDKAYVHHTSDSLILDAIEYFESHPHRDLYPEALYYGGRVYSDMGDYPTSLQYFQQALELLPAEGEHLHLRGNVLAQTGRLMEKLRLYEQAIPYVDEALTIDSIEGDPYNLAYDHVLRGMLAVENNQLDIAQQHLEKARGWAEGLSERDFANIMIDIAAIAFKRGDLQTAKETIESYIDKIDMAYRNYALLYAIRIYSKLGDEDKAYNYSFELAHSNDPNNRRAGFKYLLSDELAKFSTSDSLRSYVQLYKDEVDLYMDRRDSEQVLIQNAYYNYKKYVKERILADNKRKNSERITLVLCFFSLICLSTILWLKNKNKRTIIRLRNAIDDITKLKAIMNSENQIEKSESTLTPENNPVMRSDANSLRQRLKNELLSLSNGTEEVVIPEYIKESPEYALLQTYLNEGRSIPDKHEIWNRLEKLLNSNSDELNKKLRLLTGGVDLKPHELHTIYLIKCGFNPTQLATLLAKTKGTLSYRRRAISGKILGEELSPNILDNIIRVI